MVVQAIQKTECYKFWSESDTGLSDYVLKSKVMEIAQIHIRGTQVKPVSWEGGKEQYEPSNSIGSSIQF